MEQRSFCFENKYFSDGTKCLALGWGRTELQSISETQKSNHLQKVEAIISTKSALFIDFIRQNTSGKSA